MRACVIVLAFAVVAFGQPAYARSHSHKAVHRHHHHVHQFHHRHRVARPRIEREAPIISGYAMPQSFARTDAADSAAAPQGWQPRPLPAAFEQRSSSVRVSAPRNSALDAMIARHAQANGLPVELVHRVVIRESRYNPRARNGSALGLMQIKHATARGIGYTGPASGLLDAETNLTYAVRYLAGAYRAAGGNQSRAVAYYASGYHGRGLVARRGAGVMTAEASGPWNMQASSVGLRNADDAVRFGAPRRHRARYR